MLCRELAPEATEPSDFMWLSFVLSLQVRGQAQRGTVIFLSDTANQRSQLKVRLRVHNKATRLNTEPQLSVFLSLGEAESIIRVRQL